MRRREEARKWSENEKVPLLTSASPIHRNPQRDCVNSNLVSGEYNRGIPENGGGGLPCLCAAGFFAGTFGIEQILVLDAVINRLMNRIKRHVVFTCDFTWQKGLSPYRLAVQNLRPDATEKQVADSENLAWA